MCVFSSYFKIGKGDNVSLVETRLADEKIKDCYRVRVFLLFQERQGG